MVGRQSQRFNKNKERYVQEAKWEFDFSSGRKNSSQYYKHQHLGY